MPKKLPHVSRNRQSGSILAKSSMMDFVKRGGRPRRRGLMRTGVWSLTSAIVALEINWVTTVVVAHAQATAPVILGGRPPRRRRQRVNRIDEVGVPLATELADGTPIL